MKVKCVALFDSEGKEVDFSPWLTLGKTYQVLGVLVDSAGSKRFRIVSDDNDEGIASLGLHLDSCFEVVSDLRPSNWRDRFLGEGLTDTSPQAWQSEGFWEALYDGDPIAFESFISERRLIEREEALLGTTTG